MEGNDRDDTENRRDGASNGEWRMENGASGEIGKGIEV